MVLVRQNLELIVADFLYSSVQQKERKSLPVIKACISLSVLHRDNELND